MKNLMILCLISFLVSCTEKSDLQPSEYVLGGGVFVLNEGNFNGGNGSLSFYSYDSTTIYNDLFTQTNARPLGDIPNSITVFLDKAYIVVNNSGKVEVIDKNTLKSTGTIRGLISPRNMAVINDSKAYVTSLYSDSVAILNLHTNSIMGYINIGRSSEAIAIAGTNAYVSNWMNGNKVMVINLSTNSLKDSIDVGVEPESMVVDKTGKLWVLCNGGWRRDKFAEFDIVNTLTNDVVKKLVFPSLQDSPSCLKIDGLGQTLYYINGGVRSMDISSSSIPGSTLITHDNYNFYKIAVNPVNSDIFVTDAADYMHAGNLLLYKNDGTFVSKNSAGIIPGSMGFNLTLNTQK